jgi:glycosyltransferase involved in cell wall biosynthesis
VKVFLAGASFLLAEGGPAVSVSRFACALAKAGVEVGLWAADQSAVTTPLVPAGSAVRRLTGSAESALESFGKPDILHDNGLWLWYHHRLAGLAAKRGLPRVVSTRGMLEPWSISRKKWKKAAAWRLYQRQDLKRAQCHHATAEVEALNIRHLGLNVPICTIPNGVDVPEVAIGVPRADVGPKTALYLGRINPNKGLPMLIEAWARVQPEGWRLKIVGPDEEGHCAEVRQAVAAAYLEAAVSFVGPLDGEEKQSAFFDADLFVLPTYSENFGNAVAEALAHGLPVLTTTGAPWSMLQKRGCGWWVAPTADGISEGLRQATLCEIETLQAMGAKGRAWVASEFGWERIAEQFVATYENILGG